VAGAVIGVVWVAHPEYRSRYVISMGGVYQGQSPPPHP